MMIRRLSACLAILFSILLSSCGKKTLFKQLSSNDTNIHFKNQIDETDSINVLIQGNVYNGGGVGFGDFNGDGLQDIYFTGNLVSNKLYLNKGNLKFEDITDAAGVGGMGRWSRGVSVVDINNDGLEDIYVCATILRDSSKRKNMLFVNQGVDKNGIPHFKDLAKEYGLEDGGYCTQAAFFDYDNDGDLDVYVCVNEIADGDYPNKFTPRKLDGSSLSTGRLYRNDWNDSLKHPVFTNVSKQAGILIEGYGHQVTIADINQDGWKDIYVTNDYVSNNILYINNHDGTFTDKLGTYFKHTCANAMGNDIIDVNNDGLADVVELDMNPEGNFRKKMNLFPNQYQTYQNTEYFGYTYQYVRNMLQLNQGRRVNAKDSLGDPVFSDIGFFSGIAETDWSWAPLVTDFDNDGNRDIIVTNGFPRDVMDHDFVTYRNEAYSVASVQQLLLQDPQVKILNYAFRNNGNLHFSNVTSDWGIETPSFSNGAAYADLDNDGDMDYVVNNINDEAMVFQNLANETKGEKNNFIDIKFQGNPPNRDGFGTWVDIYYQHGQHQVYETNPVRGYLSSLQNIAHFGLGDARMVDSLRIRWPDGSMQLMINIPSRTTLTAKQSDAHLRYEFQLPVFATSTLFKEISDSLGLNETYKERDFIDFNIQKLLPHKLSEYGPALAVGDLNGDGTEDLVMGGSFANSAKLFFQQPGGTFKEADLTEKASTFNKSWEDMGLLVFDADNDGDLDIYVAAGSYENPSGSPYYQDRLFINDGKGNFVPDSINIPQNHTSKSCVRAFDYDKDGLLDLFIAGRVDPSRYPAPVSSFIYHNESKNGVPKFRDVTQTVAPELANFGLACDALFTDFDNDGWVDLIVAAEWKPLSFFKNDHGVFKNVTSSTGIADKIGWWTSIVAGDFDNDGKTDYVVGNMGLNSFYRASVKEPVRIYAKDFDNNGSYDAIPSLYLPDPKGDRKEFPAQGRDDLVKQMIEMRRKFLNYKSFANATMDQLLTPDQLKGALILEANTFASCYIHNLGNGKFEMKPLPQEAQFSTVNAMIAEDFDGDGNLDVAINANDYGTEVSVGRYDAMNGLVLKGDGKGNFTPMAIHESGLFIAGNGKSMALLRSVKGTPLVVAAENRGPLRTFAMKQPVSFYPINIDDMFADIHYANGTIRKQEFYFGSSFLSQSTRYFLRTNGMSKVEVTNNKGNKRTLF